MSAKLLFSPGPPGQAALAAAVLCLALAAAPEAHADAQAGRTKAQMCTTCHGPMGMATMANTPNLAGQPEAYLVEQLKAFRAGKRVHEVMGVIAKGLSDDDIANLSEWFSSIQIQLKDKP